MKEGPDNTKSALHWVHQTVKLFPQIGEGPTHEFLAAFASLLSKYPESVIREVLDPTTGLPVKSEYLPALSKIKDALDRAVEAQEKFFQRERRVRAQLEERALLEAPRGFRPTYEELIATLPESLRIKAPELKPVTEAEFLAKFTFMTKEQLDAIPNATTGPFAKLDATNSQSQPAKPSSSPPEEPNPFEAPQ